MPRAPLRCRWHLSATCTQAALGCHLNARSRAAVGSVHARWKEFHGAKRIALFEESVAKECGGRRGDVVAGRGD